MVLYAFSWNRVREMKHVRVPQAKKIASIQVSFWGELPEEEGRETRLRQAKKREPKLEPAIREPEAGPGLLFTKTGAALPDPMTGIEEIASSLVGEAEEEQLLEGEGLPPKREVPDRRPHLLEKESR